MDQVVVLNASHEVLDRVPWQRAVTMVVAGEAEMHETDPNRVVRSQFLTLPFPRVIRLVKYVYVKFKERVVGRHASRSAILARDGGKCAYCGGPGATVDHVIPRSRGGESTWTNLVTACLRCNQKKRNRTPAEAKMPLLWKPERP